MRNFFLTLTAALLAAFSVSAQEVEILSGYSDFRNPGALTTNQPMELVSDWVIGFPELAEGWPRLTLTSEIGEDGRLTIEIAEYNLPDDSVGAVQRRYELAPSSTGGWALMAYGHRQQCRRGSDGEWQAEPCL